jgi:hypothetical protein
METRRRNVRAWTADERATIRRAYAAIDAGTLDAALARAAHVAVLGAQGPHGAAIAAALWEGADSEGDTRVRATASILVEIRETMMLLMEIEERDEHTRLRGVN